MLTYNKSDQITLFACMCNDELLLKKSTKKYKFYITKSLKNGQYVYTVFFHPLVHFKASFSDSLCSILQHPSCSQ